VYDQSTNDTLYKKLLVFYPRAFREQLGESYVFDNLNKPNALNDDHLPPQPIAPTPDLTHHFSLAMLPRYR
jgi:hypothetical protein